MLNELKLREDAFKVAVFIGDSYLSNYCGGYINKIANADIHCCIVEPRTQYGSANGTTDTDGDGLTDWTEVNKAKVMVNFDGSVQLPTYKEYVEKYCSNRLFFIGWGSSYYNVRNAQGKSLSKLCALWNRTKDIKGNKKWCRIY